jgi:hypothetical protein
MRDRMDMPGNHVVLEQTGDEAADLSGCQAMTALLVLDPRPDGVFSVSP